MNSIKTHVPLQQYGAPSHSAKNTRSYLQSENSLLSSMRYGQHSPDWNLVDYAVWGALNQQVYCDDCLKLWNS